MTEKFSYPRKGVRVVSEGLKVLETINRAQKVFVEEYRSCLLSPGAEVTQQDAERVRKYLLEAFPRKMDNNRTHDHLELTAIFAAEIAKKLSLNPHEFYVLGLLHDVGRLLTHPEGVDPHRYFRNDLLGGVLMKRLQIPPELQSKLQPHDSYLRPKHFQSIEKFTLEQRIIIIADICGKRKIDGSIQSFQETLQYHHESRARLPTNEDGPWPSQNSASKMATDNVRKQWGELYESIASWLLKERKIDIEQIRQDIEKRERESST